MKHNAYSFGDLRIIFLLILFLSIGMADAQNFQVERFSTGSGGVTTGGTFVARTIIGEPDAGRLMGGNYVAEGGFLSLLLLNDSYWLPSNSGNWEAANNWTLGTPKSVHSLHIANTNSKVVTIDATTSAAFSNTMTVRNLTLSGPGGSVNTLFLNNAGLGTPLRVTNKFDVLGGGALRIDNSAMEVDYSSPTASLVFDGTVSINNGVFSATNGATEGIMVGVDHPGTVSMTNGQFNARRLIVGAAGQSGRGFDGTVTLVNSTSRFTYLRLAEQNDLIGSVTVIGGEFSAVSGPSQIGNHNHGIGQVTFSNAAVQLGELRLGTAANARGSLELQSGTLGSGPVFVGANSAASGSILVSGGQMTLPELHIGLQGTGSVSIAGGKLTSPVVTVSESSTAASTLNVSGGTLAVSTSLTVGNCLLAANGLVTLNNGAVYVTNAARTAVLDVRGGTFTESGGTLMVDTLILTNVCGHFNHFGGALVYNQLVIDPALDADGDGESNANESLAGTDPLSASSVFRITSALKSNKDLRLDWTTVGGHKYVVQTSTNLTGTFFDLSNVINVGGQGEGTTSYVHSGGATNRARFYRVRLVQ